MYPNLYFELFLKIEPLLLADSLVMIDRIPGREEGEEEGIFSAEENCACSREEASSKTVP